MIRYVISATDFDDFANRCVASGAFLRIGSSLISKIGPAAISEEDEGDQPSGSWVLICNGLTSTQKQNFNITSESEA
jgi:hypothetical protein